MKEPTDDSNLQKFLLELSMYQDQLLQNYRLIFISSQTILIPIAMLVLITGEGSIPSLLSYIILLCIGIILLRFWRAITENRELDVTYCHMQLLRLEKKDKPLIPDEQKKPWKMFKEWQDKTQDAKICEITQYKPCLLSSMTRKKMKKLPIYFYLIWFFGFIIWIILSFKIDWTISNLF